MNPVITEDYGHSWDKGNRMNIVKWMRKNNRKLMAGVVIVIMISFVGGTALQQLLSRWGSGAGSVVATYRDKGKISPIDLRVAEGQLMILRDLLMPMFLQYKSTPAGTPDIRARLLGQLIFPDSQGAAMMQDEIRQSMARSGSVCPNNSTPSSKSPPAAHRKLDPAEGRGPTGRLRRRSDPGQDILKQLIRI
jgi:hypothetical protein